MKQRLRFAKLYRNCKQEFANTVSAMWGGNPHTPQQELYAKQLRAIANGIFAPEDAMPLVECMDPYETIKPEEKEKAIQLVNGLWKNHICLTNIRWRVGKFSAMALLTKK